MNKKNYFKFWLNNLNIFSRKNILTDKTKSIYDIDFSKLKNRGVKLIIFDYDDTLTGFHDDLSDKTKKFLSKLEVDFEIAILSNFPKSREEALLRNLIGHNIYLEKESNKPSTKGYLKILNKFNKTGKETLMVGDKLGTDLWGAYLAGIENRILVNPFSKEFSAKKPNLIFKLQRSIEILVYKMHLINAR